MTATPASKRVLIRLDDLQASLGDVMTRINRLEEAVRAIVNVGQEHTNDILAVAQKHSDAIKLHGTLIQDLARRIEALERSDG